LGFPDGYFFAAPLIVVGAGLTAPEAEWRTQVNQDEGARAGAVGE